MIAPDSLTDVTQPGLSETFSFVVASNRLPVVWRADANGSSAPQATPGGLVTAMTPVVAAEKAVWVGSSGRSDVAQQLMVIDLMTLFPVSLNDDVASGHYDGFSNQTLWPLCHDVGVEVIENESWEASYRHANQIFAEVIAQLAAPNATVWIHDYQLMLAPAMLRALRDDLTIGYFHHIPFPSLEALGKINRPRAVVEGLLGSDLVGFQIPEDVARFRNAVTEFGLGNVHAGGVTCGERTIKFGDFPISLDFEAVSSAASAPAVRARALSISEELGAPRTMFLGADRIDYTKGIPERLLAFGQLLDRGQLSAADVVFVQAGSPSREAVGAYQNLQARIGGIVADINARHTTPGGRAPVRYVAENLPRDEMLALYRAADVMVVTPLRDGMNLVVKEFVACRSDLGGVVVLSSGAGAAVEMQEALIVDPRDVDALAEAMLVAAAMEPQEARRRMTLLRETVRSHNVHQWSDSFLVALRGQRG